MNKFSWTRSFGEDIFYATLIAENEHTPEKWRLTRPTRNGREMALAPRVWNVAILEAGVDGPPAFSIAGTGEA